ncbi:MAG: Planctomycete cytochrome [Chthoniobacteraceae bacterium]|nr:Planctomycete cytochrome [Chthoniobacteraceae bacterium]
MSSRWLLLMLVLTQPASAETDFFNEKIAPLLELRCYKCHSHQSGKMKGGLTLDSRSGWAEGGESGPALLPGDVEKSLLIRAIRHGDPDLKMPKEKLPPEEVALLEEWVRRGAPDPRGAVAVEKKTDWWSLKPLARPPVPGSGHPVDAFIAAKLQEKNIARSPAADRNALIRRLYFDLQGLPPAPEEVEAFARSNDPEAYPRLVDQLLASPRYGERWARHWLDVIHFADTHGFEHDVFRPNAWRYRDYVISSFNRDTPWPRFIREQLATDTFFPDESPVALGFLGAGPYDMSAAGTAPKAFEYMDRDDLVTQTMAAFVSTTANCARCHAHKFDPITQEDYFALQAVFAGIGKGDIPFDEDPVVATARKRWNTLLAAANTAASALLLSEQPFVTQWETDRGGAVVWEPLEADVFLSSNGAVLTRQPDASILSNGPRPEIETCTISGTGKLPEITALRLDVLADDSLPMKGPGRADNGNLHLSEFEAALFEPGATEPRKLKFSRASADFDQTDWGIARALDGDLKTAWGIHPRVGESHHAVFELEQKTVLKPGSKLVVVLKQLHGASHIIGRFRLSMTSAPGNVATALPSTVEQVLAIPSNQRTLEQRTALAAFVLKRRAEEELARLPVRAKVYAASSAAENERGVITLLEPRVIRVLTRGDLDKPEAEATPGALSAITALKARFEVKNEAGRRAALADWLADPQNPLMWRSIANRVWQFHFGRGLCDTPSDFGHMGGIPSHPELLDWLATELRENGGSLKALHRLICTSAAYRQASAENPGASAIDPDNRLLWKMNRSRLDADEFRDAVLSTSGRLDLTTGGPGISHFKSSPGPQATPSLDYSVFDWDSPGASRRSIYRVVWRGIADPFMETLDFPDAALLAPVRGFSVSPLQALALLNNEFVLRQSEHFAARIEKLGSCTGDRIRAAFRLAYFREPDPGELADFTKLADQYTLSAACRVLFNSNEFLFLN